MQQFHGGFWEHQPEIATRLSFFVFLRGLAHGGKFMERPYVGVTQEDYFIMLLRKPTKGRRERERETNTEIIF